MDKFTLVFFRMPLNGAMAGKEVQTDGKGFSRCFADYHLTDDGCVVWQYHGQAKTIVGKWFQGH